jgi:predicted DNA-binding transcriptional regulator YafY
MSAGSCRRTPQVYGINLDTVCHVYYNQCTMQSGRLLAALLLLQAKGRMRARELADHLEVSVRTVYRDIDALSAAGVPVYAERGAHGGVVLADGYRQALTHLAEDEVRALFVAGENPLAGLADVDARPLALQKLAGALSQQHRSAIEAAVNRLYVDPRRWWQPAQPREHLARLQQAVWEDRRVRLRYEDRNRTHTERTVEPLALVTKAGIWYLVARFGREMRTFRADRILEVHVLDERFERPSDFHLRDFWRSWVASYEAHMPSYPVLLKVGKHDFEDMRECWRGEVLAERPHSHTLLVRFNFPERAMAVRQLLAWAPRDVDIVEPEDLRTEVIACARAALKRYAHRSVPAAHSA